MLRDRLILASIGFGFLLLAVEIRAMHHSVVQEHWQAWIPVGYGGLAFLAGVGGAIPKNGPPRWLAWVFVLGVLVGLYGLLLHGQGHPEGFGALIDAKDEFGETLRATDGAPVLAPAGIAGLGAIGALICWMRPSAD